METCCNYIRGEEMYFSSDEIRWVNRIIKMAEEHPDEVKITALPDENDGTICARMPAAWLNIRPPRTRTISDEQKKAATERLLRARGLWKEDDSEEDGDENESPDEEE